MARNINSKMTPEDELLDVSAQSILRDLHEDASSQHLRGPHREDDDATSLHRSSQHLLRGLTDQGETVHHNASFEHDAHDAAGYQGGQSWTSRAPTPSPTAIPTTASPTRSPTQYPTLQGWQFFLRGVVWYDRNANGVRDSNVAEGGLGSDVEYSQGVGGVQVMLVQCDPKTGK